LYQSLSHGVSEGWSILFQRYFVNAGGDSGAIAGNGYEKIIAIDLLLVSFWDVLWVEGRSRNLESIDSLTTTNVRIKWCSQKWIASQSLLATWVI
jgi:hypothetical protein